MNKAFIAKCLACVPISSNTLQWDGPLTIQHTRMICRNTLMPKKGKKKR